MTQVGADLALRGRVGLQQMTVGVGGRGTPSGAKIQRREM